MTNVTGIDRRDDNAPALSKSLISSCSVFVAVSCLYIVIWSKAINPYFNPYGDSFSLLVNSIPPFHPSYSAWFLHGFQTYFDVYPDMSLHATNFIRPGVNATFCLEWFLFGSHWSRYLLTTYAIIGLISAVTCFIATHILKLSWRVTLLAVICVSVAPSIDTGAIVDPTFAFDLLAGLLVLLGITALTAEFLPAAWICFTLAIFTKETALFAPALAAGIVLFHKRDQLLLRRAAASVLFLLPLACWLLLRSHDFRGEKGVYVLMDGSSHSAIHVILVRILLGMATWPLAATVFGSSIPTSLAVLQKTSHWINISFWNVLIWIVVRKLWRLRGNPSSIGEPLQSQGTDYAITVLSLFCATSILIPLALDVPRRFGGVFFPLFILCMSSAADYSNKRLLRAGATGMVLATGLVGIAFIVRDFRDSIPSLRPTWALAGDYVSQLASSHEPELFVIDDLSGRYASTEYVKRFAGYQGELIRVNDLQWNYKCDDTPAVSLQPKGASAVSITSVVSGRCGDYSFNSVFPPVDPTMRSLIRRLPAAEIQYTFDRQTDPAHPAAASSTMTLELEPVMAGGALLYPDVRTQRYRKIPLP
jgi:hypothetical protein